MVTEFPYQPPQETEDTSSLPKATAGRTRLWQIATSFFCFGWFVILFLLWQLDGLNFLIQRDIGRLVSISTGCITLLATLLYVRQRFGTTNGRCIAYAIIAALLQLAILYTIKSHSIERLPM